MPRSASILRATALPLPVQMFVGGRDVGAETLLSDVGYTLVMQTAIPHRDMPIDVHSIYVGAPGAPTRITHVLIAGDGQPARTGQRTVAAASIPVSAARRRCLEDHLQRLVDLLLELGHDPRIDFSQLATALDAADRA